MAKISMLNKKEPRKNVHERFVYESADNRSLS